MHWGEKESRGEDEKRRFRAVNARKEWEHIQPEENPMILPTRKGEESRQTREKKEIEEAVNFALKSPHPDTGAAADGVFA